MDARDHVAIIGAGQAGAALAARLRLKGYDGRITLFGAEPHRPYQRPPLSKKYLSGEWDSDRLDLRAATFWAENRIELCLGRPVTHIHAHAQTLSWSGQEVGWTKLAFTTGAAPRPRPAIFAGRADVFELRGLDDVDRMRAAFRPSRRLAVVGGGFIGLETAAVAAQMGLKVTVIEQAPRILERVVCPETAAFFRALHLSNGVRLLEGCGVTGVEDAPEGGARLELSTGERLDADAVLLGIGVVPQTRLAEEAGAALATGILVDAHGRTSLPRVWAAGDCAAFPFAGEITRLESVQNAIDQAEAAADDMLGIGSPYAPVPWFWSDQYDTKLQIAGLNRGYTEVVTRSAGRSLSSWYFGPSGLIAVDAVNDGRTFMIAKKLLAEPAQVDPSALADPAFDPRALLARA